ncbi:hypothetical protein HYDPIDRAFT_170754 [Hydnomerulius pinastri MD-312]|uniref:Uncharacterized protein n=1 Tax=Hydnomerulius pinastri MD-312 TaxID=994086 RepID=A0A0C9W9K4_9AGAM|nr:hypothetical protein HYDPIDRAFT_170754 [Hydnomerulius pinastri MD-312]
MSDAKDIDIDTVPPQTPGVEGAVAGPTIHHAAAVCLDDIEMELDSVDAATAELRHTVTEQKKAIQHWTAGNKALSIKQSSAYQSEDKLDEMVNSIQRRLEAVLVRNADLRTLIASAEGDGIKQEMDIQRATTRIENLTGRNSMLGMLNMPEQMEGTLGGPEGIPHSVIGGAMWAPYSFGGSGSAPGPS